MSWLVEQMQLQEEVRSFDRSIRLTSKNGWFWKVVAWALFIISFGKFKREDFLTRFATTIGNVQAYPEEWSVATVRRVMVHESRHCFQARVCGFGIHPMAGLPVMTLLYALLPLPMFFAFFRCWFELDADRTEWRYALAHGSADAAVIRWRAQNFAETVSGPAYMWSVWRSLAVWWFTREAEKVIAEHQSK
jgi:hypothetical protein